MLRRNVIIDGKSCDWHVDGLCCYRIIERLRPAGKITLPGGVPKLARPPTVRELLALLPPTAPEAKDIECAALSGEPCRRAMPPATPRYDRRLRQFLVGPFMLREFQRSADNQVGILDAFEDENWPARVELAVRSDLDPEHKTNNAVSNLNHGQVLFLVRFFCDGIRGVRWELVK